MILIGRMLPLILVLTIIQLINLHILLAHGPNPVGVIILMNNWIKYSANLLTHLILIRLLDPVGEAANMLDNLCMKPSNKISTYNVDFMYYASQLG